jgi:YVTN family beta-propeller protein
MKQQLISFLTLCAALLTTPAWAADKPWAITDRIHVGGGGDWDYLVVQPETKRLFVSHAKQVVVIDLKSKEIIGSIEADGVHGIALAPELNRGFISNGAGNNVTVFDLTTLKVETHLATGQNPDAICYEAKTKRVFAFNGKSGTATVVDAVGEKVIGEIPLGGKPEFAQADGKGFVFDDLEDKSQVVKIDAASLTVIARWPLPAESGPSGLAVDPVKDRLFIGCGNKTLAVMDGTSGKILATLPIGQGVDACSYDPVHDRAFASCGDGTMTVVQQSDNADTYAVSAIVQTEPKARTMAFDLTTGIAYLPDAKFGPAPAPTAKHPKPRPSILPGSLEILVIAQKS